MVLFIQEGLTYYISVQSAALFFIVAFLSKARVGLSSMAIGLSIYIPFSLFLLFTATVHPDTISQNSPNITVTSIGVLAYVAFILAMTILRPVRAEWVLLFYRRAASMVITMVVALVVITDLGVIPGLTREFFIYQNVGLITNFTTTDVLDADFAGRNRRGVPADIDLFFGEPSFLALVLFVSIVSYIIASRGLDRLRCSDSTPLSRQSIWGISIPLLFVGLACLVYIKSLSSLCYALVLLGFGLVNTFQRWRVSKLQHLKVMALLLIVVGLALVVIEVAPYYWHRLSTISGSISAEQRFGILFDLRPQDLLLGLQDRDRMPPAGIHNGLIYVVMMAGFGGISLLAYLLLRVAQLAHPLGLALLSILAFLAVFVQNGAILSPNKLVLLSFLLLPLMGARRTA